MQSDPRSRTNAGLTLALALLLFGCASGPANTLAPGNEGAPGVQRILVCAPNTVLGLPAELQDATAGLHDEIEAYLHLHDKEVEWLGLYDSKRLWNQAMSRAKQEGAIQNTPGVFAAELAKSHQFDAIVMPSILIHKVRANMGNASWDGVSRRMRIVNAPKQPVGRAQDTLAQGIARGGVSGEVMATSIHLMVFTPRGERVFEGRGGLELLHEADMAPVKRNYEYELRLRSDLLRDRAALREGLAIAFDPYLPPPAEG